MSDPEEQLYVFSYTVHIENLGVSAVHLLRRHWLVTDSLGDNKEVEGEGVVGEKPVILPGEVYEYSSWCQLASDAGKMEGSYLVKSLETNKNIEVRIPEFLLVPRFKYN